MIQVVGKHGIGCASAVIVGFLVADEYVKRLFLLRNSKNFLLNIVDGGSFFLINNALQGIAIFQGGLVVFIVKNRGELRAVDSRNTPVCGRVFHIFDTVTAQHQRPIGFRIGRVFAQNPLVKALRLVEIIGAPEMVCSIKEVCLFIVVQSWQRLLCSATVAGANRIALLKFNCSSAHFTFKY